MAKGLADDLGVNTLDQQGGGKGLTQIVEAGFWQSHLNIRPGSRALSARKTVVPQRFRASLFQGQVVSGRRAGPPPGSLPIPLPETLSGRQSRPSPGLSVRSEP